MSNSTELLPGIHLFTSVAWQMSTLVGRLDKATLVVDPGYFPGEVAEQARLLTEREAGAEDTASAESGCFLLLTHGDFDHVAGFGQLPPVAGVIGHAGLRRRRPDKIQNQIRNLDRQFYVERTAPFCFPYPTDPINAPSIREIGDERLHLFPAPGHTADSLFTVFERRGLFLAGDYLSDLEFPFVYDRVDRYLEALDLAARLVEEFRPRLLVPGHGPVAEGFQAMRERIDRDRRYLEGLRSEVEAAVAKGCPLSETQRRLANLEYRNGPIPDHLRSEHQANVKRLHHRLRRALHHRPGRGAKSGRLTPPGP